MCRACEAGWRFALTVAAAFLCAALTVGTCVWFALREIDTSP